MKRWYLLVAFLPLLSSIAMAAEKQPLRVLFVGTSDSPRTQAYQALLTARFASVQMADRASFDPGTASGFDVVVLDWPQVVSEMRVGKNAERPLGDREKWGRPTVLLGSAGLNLACQWETLGGFGCTCLQPFAFNPRDHALFKQPNIIATGNTIRHRAPEAFAKIAGSDLVDVVPLVSDVNQNYPNGWATHADELLESPEVELISGGINDQTPKSLAIWRQGNLIHFGFEQAPDLMNDTGKDLLVNVIAYASRFSEDRPIARTPSIFVNDNYPRSRKRLSRYAVDMTDKDIERFFDEPSLKTAAAAKAWFAENRQWLHASKDGRLTLDADAKRLGWSIDDIAGVSALLNRFDSDPAIATLLARYIPDGPGAQATLAAWRQWWDGHRDYVFFSDAGGYRFYIDPLAKKRGISTANLRGPLRADKSPVQTMQKITISD